MKTITEPPAWAPARGALPNFQTGKLKLQEKFLKNPFLLQQARTKRVRQLKT